MLVNILALVWGGSMLINFMWHRVATNPKPNETDGLLDFGVDFLNKIPIQWSVLGAVADPRRHLLRGAQLEDPLARALRRPGGGRRRISQPDDRSAGPAAATPGAGAWRRASRAVVRMST